KGSLRDHRSLRSSRPGPLPRPFRQLGVTPMAEPVLVVHGVANRNQRDFERLVGTLQDNVGKQYDLIHVYWGDLAAATAGIRDTIPSLSDGAADRALRLFGPEDHASLLRKQGGTNHIHNQE